MNGVGWHLPWHLLFMPKKNMFDSRKFHMEKKKVQIDECQNEDNSVMSDDENNSTRQDDSSECDSDDEVVKDNNMDSDIDSNMEEDGKIGEKHMKKLLLMPMMYYMY